jgi:hypothetical protein
MLTTPRWLIEAVKRIALRRAARGEVVRLAERSGRDPHTLVTLISRARRSGRIPDYWREADDLSAPANVGDHTRQSINGRLDRHGRETQRAAHVV